MRRSEGDFFTERLTVFISHHVPLSVASYSLMKTAEMASINVAEEMTELVGNTPIFMSFLLPAVPAVYAKLEYLNPGGSIKDRAALGMITKAERDGRLKPGATIFEATAGNTGVGLALIASGRGYKTVLAVPEGFSQEKVTLMEALGAEVIRTPQRRRYAAAIATSRHAPLALPTPSSPPNSKISTIPTFTTRPRAASSTTSSADRSMPSSSAAARAARLPE